MIGIGSLTQMLKIAGLESQLGKPSFAQNPQVYPKSNIMFQSYPNSMSIEDLYQEKVSFGEGIKLVTKGFFGKIGNMFKSLVKHPLKVLGSVALIAAGLAALPLVGIATTTGAAVLTFGFAAVSIGKTVKDIAKAMSHNKEGEYNELRKDLKDIGGDGVDLALSLPFMPKAINQIQRQMKFSPTPLKFNSTLWQQVKNTEGTWAKFKTLSQADVKMMYEQHIKEMGLTNAPELKFTEMPMVGTSGYNSTNKEILMDTRTINPFTSSLHDGVLKHELKHFEQFSTMAEGISPKAQFYTEAWANHPKTIPFDKESLISYFKNPLEKEAYLAQFKYKIFRPDLSTNIEQSVAQIVNNDRIPERSKITNPFFPKPIIIVAPPNIYRQNDLFHQLINANEISSN